MAFKRKSCGEIRDFSLRDKDKVTTEMFGNIAAVESKLCWWEHQFILYSYVHSPHTKWGFSDPVKADSHIACRAHAVPLPCRADKGLECVFPI
jgi:hypothetical protein